MWGDGVGKFGSNRQRQVSNEASILIISRYEVTYSRISPPYYSDAIRRDFALHSETSTLFLAIIFFHFSVCIPPSSSSPYVPIVHSPSIPQVPILLPHAKTGNRRRADFLSTDLGSISLHVAASRFSSNALFRPTPYCTKIHGTEADELIYDGSSDTCGIIDESIRDVRYVPSALRDA